MRAKNINKILLWLIISIPFVACSFQKELVDSDDLCFKDFDLLEEEKSIDIDEYELTNEDCYRKFLENDTIKIYYSKYNDRFLKNHSENGRKFYFKEVIQIRQFYKNYGISHLLKYDTLGNIIGVYFSKIVGTVEESPCGSLTDQLKFGYHSVPIGPIKKYKSNGELIYCKNFTPPETYKICASEAIHLIKRKIRWKRGYRDADFHLFNISNLNSYLSSTIDTSSNVTKEGWRVFVRPKPKYAKRIKKEYLSTEYFIDAKTGDIIHKIRYRNGFQYSGGSRIYFKYPCSYDEMPRKKWFWCRRKYKLQKLFIFRWKTADKASKSTKDWFGLYK